MTWEGIEFRVGGEGTRLVVPDGGVEEVRSAPPHPAYMGDLVGYSFRLPDSEPRRGSQEWVVWEYFVPLAATCRVWKRAGS